MSYYDVFSVILAVVLVWAAYHKGCRDTWRKADEIAQMEDIFPPKREPQPIELPFNPFLWPELTSTNGTGYQAEQEQAL